MAARPRGAGARRVSPLSRVDGGLVAAAARLAARARHSVGCSTRLRRRAARGDARGVSSPEGRRRGAGRAARMRLTSADAVRSAIAEHMLGEHSSSVAMGDVNLHLHQQDGVERVQRLLEQHGGALLADDVGLGKTYVALAVARAYQHVLVVAPAALRDTWAASAERAAARITFASVQSLA